MDKKDIMEMMKKKKDGKKDHKMAGKMCALEELKKVASSMMGDDMDDMQKVTVAAKDKEGLKEGLKKAKELLSKKS